MWGRSNKSKNERRESWKVMSKKSINLENDNKKEIGR
jgi:hypothetical protein